MKKLERALAIWGTLCMALAILCFVLLATAYNRWSLVDESSQKAYSATYHYLSDAWVFLLLAAAVFVLLMASGKALLTVYHKYAVAQAYHRHDPKLARAAQKIFEQSQGGDVNAGWSGSL
jgi:Na+/proline symporter